jgi:peptide deformylase
MEEAGEICLSIPGFMGIVERHKRIVVQARNEWGKAKRIETEGFIARVMQHEIDHLDGLLYLNRLQGEGKLFELVPEEEEGA